MKLLRVKLFLTIIVIVPGILGTFINPWFLLLNLIPMYIIAHVKEVKEK